jgi:U3 small nucleolar RNA-associated protein 23
VITQCCIHELYLQGKSLQPAVDLAKSFERRKCNHREPIPGDDCVASVVGVFFQCSLVLSAQSNAGETNKHRYVIATQSQPLRARLRTIPAVPLLHINRSVMVLEPPSDVTIKAKEAVSSSILHEPPMTLDDDQTEEQDLHVKPSDLALVGTPNAEPVKKKRKGPKGPNPLSVKKKQVIRTPIADSRVGEKRKRDALDAEVKMEANIAAGLGSENTHRRRRRRTKTSQTIDDVQEVST